MKWSKLSHVGLVRKNNEDYSCVCDDIPFLAVADGMGGHKAGEVASKLALDAVAEYLRGNSGMVSEDPVEALKAALAHANTVVFGHSREDGEKLRGMGTTITAVLPREDKIYIAHVGDSRAYQVRGDSINLLTSDHSLVNELVKSGGLTAEEAANHPQRNVLTRAVGTAPSVDVDVDIETVRQGDVIILCTDGLSNRVDLEEMKLAAAADAPLAERARRLVDAALEHGGADNITVILFQVD